MSNSNSFQVVKHRRWFRVMGPESSIDPEVESHTSHCLADMMLNHIEIMNAYRDGFLSFSNDISDAEEEEIRDILTQGVSQEEVQYLFCEDEE